MKKIIYFITALLILLSVNTANGQQIVIRDAEDVETENTKDDESVKVFTYDNKENIALNVAGVEINIRQGEVENIAVTTVKKNKRKFAKPGHIAFMEVGLNMLPNPNYSGYTDDTFLDLHHGLSQQWAFCIPDISFKLAPSGIVSVSAGLQFIWNNYVFANDITLVKQDGRLVPVPVQNPKKTKLATFGFQIPVLLELNLPGNVFIAGGIYGGVNLGMNTKVKFPKEKMRDPYINPFYGGVTGRVGYRSFYVYANYGLTSLFQTNKGPEVFPLTIGVGIGF